MRRQPFERIAVPSGFITRLCEVRHLRAPISDTSLDAAHDRLDSAYEKIAVDFERELPDDVVNTCRLSWAIAAWPIVHIGKNALSATGISHQRRLRVKARFATKPLGPHAMTAE